MTRRTPTPRDEVTRWLERLAPSTALFCKAEVRAPWGFRVERRDTATFHIVTGGAAWLEVEGANGDAIRLTEGDLVLLPTGAPHALRDMPTSVATPLGQAVASGMTRGKWVSFGGPGPVSEMVCGACTLGVPGGRPPHGLLPVLLRHRLEPGLLDVVRREAEGLDGGTEAVLTQLLTLLVLQALRAHLAARTPEELRALMSPEVGRAVAFIHENLDREFRIADLCREAALSSTTLSEQFRESLGLAPMEYARLARLSRARELARNTSWGLARIARHVGYGSASTLSRAFRRRYGVPPGSVRRRTERTSA